jgi:protocatechuate 3,4-dioxygenase beta subunit
VGAPGFPVARRRGVGRGARGVGAWGARGGNNVTAVARVRPRVTLTGAVPADRPRRRTCLILLGVEHGSDGTPGIDSDLAALLAAEEAGCHLFPEQTQGPYHRDVHPLRRDIAEDRQGLALRLGLRLCAGDGQAPLSDVLVEIWHADRDGRYSGFGPIEVEPGKEVTSASVSREVVAPEETFLRGAARTDEHGMCEFSTIYPGWYPSRTVHIHLIARLTGREHATTQMYFPDELSDEVFAQPPYAGRPERDTRNGTDSIFAGGGEETILRIRRSPAGLTGVLAMATAAPEEHSR